MEERMREEEGKDEDAPGTLAGPAGCGAAKMSLPNLSGMTLRAAHRSGAPIGVVHGAGVFVTNMGTEKKERGTAKLDGGAQFKISISVQTNHEEGDDQYLVTVLIEASKQEICFTENILRTIQVALRSQGVVIQPIGATKGNACDSGFRFYVDSSEEEKDELSNVVDQLDLKTLLFKEFDQSKNNIPFHRVANRDKHILFEAIVMIRCTEGFKGFGIFNDDLKTPKYIYAVHERRSTDGDIQEVEYVYTVCYYTEEGLEEAQLNRKRKPESQQVDGDGAELVRVTYGNSTPTSPFSPTRSPRSQEDAVPKFA
jgi:hypothetical protein